MLRSIKIKGFRCFQEFELQQLGRLNLLVGTNNSGKTSVLEALLLLCSQNTFEALSKIMLNRGEYVWDAENGRSRELDICHLFYDHEIYDGSEFSISGFDGVEAEKVVLSIRDNVQGNFKEGSGPLELAINRSNQETRTLTTPLSVDRALFEDLGYIELKNWGVIAFPGLMRYS